MYAFYKNVTINVANETFGTGWLPPMPDLRDYSAEEPEIKLMSKKLGLTAKAEPAVPEKVDLRKWCTPIESQGTIGSCSAHAGTAMVEYFQKRANKTYIPSSRLFLYKTTRNLMQVTGDTGAWLRSVMGALALCGVAPEKYWPYKIEDFDKEPPAFIYAIADNYEALKYFCHDPAKGKVAPDEVLASLGVFNSTHMNQAVFAFRRYEDSSLSYTGIDSHPKLRHYGLYDTVIAVED